MGCHDDEIVSKGLSCSRFPIGSINHVEEVSDRLIVVS